MVTARNLRFGGAPVLAAAMLLTACQRGRAGRSNRSSRAAWPRKAMPRWSRRPECRRVTARWSSEGDQSMRISYRNAEPGRRRCGSRCRRCACRIPSATSGAHGGRRHRHRTNQWEIRQRPRARGVRDGRRRRGNAGTAGGCARDRLGTSPAFPTSAPRIRSHRGHVPLGRGNVAIGFTAASASSLPF